MAVDLATVTKTEINLPRKPGQLVRHQFSAVAVFDGERWSALCRELDIASDGDTAPEALANVKNAVREALSVASERSVSPGEPVPNDELQAFLTSHVGTQPVAGEIFFIR